MAAACAQGRTRKCLEAPHKKAGSGPVKRSKCKASPIQRRVAGCRRSGKAWASRQLQPSHHHARACSTLYLAGACYKRESQDSCKSFSSAAAVTLASCSPEKQPATPSKQGTKHIPRPCWNHSLRNGTCPAGAIIFVLSAPAVHLPAMVYPAQWAYPQSKPPPMPRANHAAAVCEIHVHRHSMQS